MALLLLTIAFAYLALLVLILALCRAAAIGDAHMVEPRRRRRRLTARLALRRGGCDRRAPGAPRRQRAF